MLPITSLEVHPFKGDFNAVAFVTVEIANAFKGRKMTLVKKSDGSLFLRMPAEKVKAKPEDAAKPEDSGMGEDAGGRPAGRREYFDVFYFTDKALREEIERKAIELYNLKSSAN